MRWELYSPSRRNSAPTSPGTRQALASPTMRRLYAAENCRRLRAGYEDLIGLRDSLSPGTHLIFHAYDFAIPDGRDVCNLGPWLKPTLDLRKFPIGSAARFEVVKAMLKQFAALLLSLASHGGVTFINGQGTLAPNPSSWHNELHPSKDGFRKFATLFHTKLKALFPARVL